MVIWLTHQLIPGCDWIGRLLFTRLPVYVDKIMGIHTLSQVFFLPFVAVHRDVLMLL